MDINFDEVIRNTSTSKHSKLFPKNIFLILVGSTGSGKTNLLLNLLLDPTNQIYFDDFYIWATTLHQPKYIFLKEHFESLEKYLFHQYNTKVEIGHFFTHDEEIIDPKELDETKSHLMIFDDVQNENQTRIKDYFCSGRHNNFNVFYLCQSLNHIKKHCIRENANIFILFRLNEKTLKSFYESHASSDMKYEEFKDFCEKAWQKDHGYVVINLWSKPHDKKYIANYKEIYTPNKFNKM